MLSSVLLFILLILNLVSKGLNHVGQPCNNIFKICLASNSYCDKENICRCKEDHPVNISLHQCKKGKYFSEKCEYSEECTYNDPNSYCTQLPYRSLCECHTGFTYNEVKRICEQVGRDTHKPPSVVFPTAIGISLAIASILCFCLIAWHACRRHGFIFLRRNLTANDRYDSSNIESQQPLPTAPIADESLPTYDTALAFKVPDDYEPPPSYEEVISNDDSLKS